MYKRQVLISRTVTVDDIFASVNYLLGLDHGIGTTDEIDHMGNRRVRSVGELLQNQFRIGFSLSLIHIWSRTPAPI